MSPRIALALGSGGAKGIAHIVVLETLDELGVRPARIVGASIGAVAGAIYAAGMSGRDIRAYLLGGIAEPMRLAKDLLSCHVAGFEDVFSFGGNPVLLDPLRIAETFLPPQVPARIEDLAIPFAAVATDYYAKETVVFRDGPLRSAIAASMAIPGLFRPVERDGRVLIDGGTTNPLPFDLLAGAADIVVAIDVNGGPKPETQRQGLLPRPLDVLFAAVQIMAHAIVEEKLVRARPAVLLAPEIGRFRTLDFLEAQAILDAAEPMRDELKRALDFALAARPEAPAG